MDYNQFYILSDSDLKDALYVLPNNQLEDYKLFKGELELTSPIIFYPNIGKKANDLIGSGYAGLNLFSSKITSMLMEHYITGWKTYPCEIYDWNSNKIEGYTIFSITGRCGILDFSKSEKVMMPPLGPKGKSIEGLKGLYFEPDSWDGADIFTPEGTKLIFVKEKVKKLFEENSITNITFKKITEFAR